MKSSTKAATVGAALAAAITVTVYEGSTVLANDAGQVALGPGERGRAALGEAPQHESPPGDAAGPVAPVSADRDEAVALREQSRRQAREIEGLRQELSALRGDEGPDDDAPAPKRFGYNGPPMPEGFDYYQPTQEALLEMAECGVVAWDQPPVWADDQQLDPGYLAALKLSADEEVALQETFEAFRGDTVAKARAFWVQMGGDPAAAESIDASELLGLVYGRTDLEVRERTREQMAMERAGLAELAPPGGSVTEELVRWDAELGNAFEAAVAERLGAERAQELREARGGWSGKRSTWADLCADR